jgi:hypothetical protein
MEQERQPTSVALGLGLRKHGSRVRSYRSLCRCLETTRLLLNAQIFPHMCHEVAQEGERS